MSESRRTQITKRILKEALVDLLEEKPLNKISIKELCECAEVNRSTFYSHYPAVSVLFAELEKDIAAHFPDFSALPDSTSKEEAVHKMADFFDYVKQNGRMFRILFRISDNENSFTRHLVQAVCDAYRQNEQYTARSHDEYEFIFCVSGVIGAIQLWLENGYPLSSREIAETMHDLSYHAIHDR